MESATAAQHLVTRESAAGRALVLKPLFGSQGQGLQRVGWVDGTHVPLPSLEGPYGGLAYLQRFVAADSAPGHDFRVLVIGGVARAAMRRVSVDWVHNVARGARCEPQSLAEGIGPELARLAEAAARALDMDYAGVDLIPTRDGAQVLEVNGVAAWQGLQGVTPFNIAQALVDDLLQRRCAAGARRLQA
jgi:glutathione synthase/RimK-type ligase-like ATP-grasp enzyme